MKDLEQIHITREDWLEAAFDLTRPAFKAAGVELPQARISCGWPSRGALSEKNPVWGQCWHVEATADGVAQVFVSPRISDPVTAMGVVYHEAVHVALGKGAKHGPKFKDLGLKLGLAGKPKEMVPGDALLLNIACQVELHLGRYPQAAIVPTEEKKPDRCRQLKVLCFGDNQVKHREYIVRTTKKNLDEFGPPICPVCEKVMQVEKAEGGEG